MQPSSAARLAVSVAGWLRDRTGGYEVTFLGLAAVGTATLVAGVATGRAASSA